MTHKYQVFVARNQEMEPIVILVMVVLVVAVHMAVVLPHQKLRHQRPPGEIQRFAKGAGRGGGHRSRRDTRKVTSNIFTKLGNVSRDDPHTIAGYGGSSSPSPDAQW